MPDYTGQAATNLILQEIQNISNGTTELVTKNKNYTTRYDIQTTAIYIGDAIIGTASNAASWRIKKFTLSGGNPTIKEWADGNENFDNIWDNRAALSYS